MLLIETSVTVTPQVYYSIPTLHGKWHMTDLRAIFSTTSENYQ